MEIYIYKHTSPSGKCYIGQTVNIKNRWKPSAYRQCIKFHMAIQKYGWENITHEIICVCETPEEANEKEAFYIKKFESVANGYNLGVGSGEILRGENNPMYGRSVKELMTDDEIAKWRHSISIALSGEGNGFYGRHHTEETKELLRSQRIGIPTHYHPTEEYRKQLSERNRKMWTAEKRKAQSEKMKGVNNPMVWRVIPDEERRRRSEGVTGDKNGHAKQLIIVDVIEHKEILCVCRRYVTREIGLSPCHVYRYLNKDKLYKNRYLLKEVS